MNEKRVLHSEASICSTLGRLAWMSRKIASANDTMSNQHFAVGLIVRNKTEAL